MTEERPNDGDYAFLGREVEWRPALAILMNDVNVGDSQAILTSTALQNYFQTLPSACKWSESSEKDRINLSRESSPSLRVH